MGGFVDCARLLSFEDIEQLVQNDKIEYPIVTQEEIRDKSKGDAVTQALVVLQTTWFLLQCATQLELATAAFAMPNTIIYVLWWDKPLNVRYSIRVRRRAAPDGEAGQNRHSDEENGYKNRSNQTSCCHDSRDLRSILRSRLDLATSRLTRLTAPQSRLSGPNAHSFRHACDNPLTTSHSGAFVARLRDPLTNLGYGDKS